MEEIIARDPSLYQDEICDYIWLEFAVIVNQPQVSRLLKRIKLNRKKLHVIAS